MNIRNYLVNYRTAAWVIFGIALALRAIALVFSNLIPELTRYVFWGDATGYVQLAVNLLTEGSFRFQGGSASAYRMPGYPIFLVITYAPIGSPVVAQFFQILADLLVLYFVLNISDFLFKDKLVGLIAITIIAIHPIFILSTIFLYPETLTILFTTIALSILLKSANSLKSGLLAGAALSAAIYLKTNMLLVATVMLLVFGLKWFFVQGGRGFFKAFVPAILVIGLMMLPWVVRNWLVMGEFIPTTTSNGVNMYRGNNPLVDGGSASNLPYVLPGMSEVESSKEFSRQAWGWIKRNPSTFLRLMPAKAGHFMWPLALAASGTIQVNTVIFGIVLLMTMVFFSLGIVGCWVTYRLDLKWELALLLSPFISLLFLSLITYGGIRYSLPALPGLAILVSVGSFYLIKRIFRSGLKINPLLESC